MNRARASATLAIAFLVAGCGAVDSVLPPMPERRGPCTLDFITTGGEPLTPPYVVTMTVEGGAPAADLMLDGSGWTGIVAIRATSPSGPIEDVGVDAAGLNAGNVGQYLDLAGAWVLEFEDAGCFQRIPVTVRPPGS